MRATDVLLYWILLANLGDLVTTLIGLSFPSVREGNPIAAFFINTNILLFLAFKLLLPTFIALGFLGIYNKCKSWFNKFIVQIAMFVLALNFTIVIVSNMGVIYRCVY